MASAQYISFEMSADVIGTGSIVTAQRMPVGIPLTPMPLCATSVHRHTPKGSATKPDSSTTDKHISEWMHQLQKTVEVWMSLSVILLLCLIVSCVDWLRQHK